MSSWLTISAFDWFNLQVQVVSKLISRKVMYFLFFWLLTTGQLFVKWLWTEPLGRVRVSLLNQAVWQSDTPYSRYNEFPFCIFTNYISHKQRNIVFRTNPIDPWHNPIDPWPNPLYPCLTQFTRPLTQTTRLLTQSTRLRTQTTRLLTQYSTPAWLNPLGS